MRAGKLRQRVALDRPTVTQSSTTGEAQTDWATVATVWAAVVPMRASKAAELVVGNREMTIREATIELRYRSDIDTTWRARHGSAQYSIRGIEDVAMAHRELRLACTQEEMRDES